MEVLNLPGGYDAQEPKPYFYKSDDGFKGGRGDSIKEVLQAEKGRPSFLQIYLDNGPPGAEFVYSCLSGCGLEESP